MATVLNALILAPSYAAAPTCRELNKTWQEVHQKYVVVGWDEKPFSCPSEKSAVAMMFEYLSRLNVKKGGFDYKSYVEQNIGYIVKGEGDIARLHLSDGAVASNRSNEIVISPYHFRDFGGTPASGLNGAVTLVHEARHSHWVKRKQTVKHVNCADGRKRACDEDLLLFMDPNVDLDNLQIGAYSFHISYLLDVSQFAHNITRQMQHSIERLVADTLKSNILATGVSAIELGQINTILGTSFRIQDFR